MALLGNNADYTDKDFDALRARLINLVRSAFPEWTDFNVANFGNILLELTAFVGDVLAFYLDNQAAESRISTAQLRRSLIGLSKLIGFTPTGAVASTAALRFTLDSPPAGNVTINAGDTFRTEEVVDPIVFQALSSASIPAGTDPPEVVFNVENSKNSTETFDSTGLPNQEIELGDTPFLEGSLQVTADDGVYTQVDNFLSSTSTDRHFVVVVDEQDRATARFGNGINGTIPKGSIVTSYKTGGGSVGNVNAGTIVRVDKQYIDSLANPVVVSVTNDNAASGGADRQSVEQIRQRAPESIRTINRTVSREDYEINARKVAGVARALMLTSNERAGIPENHGQLHVIPDGGGVPSSALKSDVLTQVTVTFPNTITFIVEVVDPVYLDVDVTATVFLEPGETASVVDARIRSNLESFFALKNADGSDNKNVDFGFNYKNAEDEPASEVPWSDVFNVVRDTQGVRKIGDDLGDFVLNGLRADVPIEVQKFPVLGKVTIINGDTGLALA